MHRSIGSALQMVGASACWGLGTVLSKYSLGWFQPLDLLNLQLAVSFTFFCVLLLFNRTRIGWSRRLYPIAALGVLNPGFAYWLGLIGLRTTSASLAALIWALEPILILVAAHLVLNERVEKKVALLLLPATAGVGLVAGVDSVAGSTTGALFILAGVAACAIYAVLMSLLITDVPVLVVLAIQQATALVVGITISMFVLDRPPLALSHADLAVWGAAVLSGVVYYSIAFWLFIGALRHTAVATVGASITLVPVFALLGASVILNERLAAEQWVGVVMAISAMTVLLRQPRSRPVLDLSSRSPRGSNQKRPGS